MFMAAVAIIVIFIFEGVPLIRKKLWKELGVFCMLMGLAAFWGMAKSFNLDTPVEWLQDWLGPIGEKVLK